MTADAARHLRLWLGAVFLVAGLMGHLLSAHAIGGYRRAYVDHITGFVLLTVVTGLILLALARRFWRGRHDITLLTLGIVQTIIGYIIWLNRFRV